MGTEGSGATRAGEADIHNEDSYLVEEGLGLYVVCDGLGSAPAGEVASTIAVNALEEFVSRSERQFGAALQREMASRRFAGRAVRHAMDAVLQASRSDSDLDGMATTVTILLAHGRHGVVGHVGDSRAFLIREDEIHQLTRDHELAEGFTEGGTDDWAHTWVETFSIGLRPADTFLLCTDGAEQVVEDPLVVGLANEMSPRMLASRIVSEAHRRDASQDATAVVVRVRRELEPSWLWLSNIPQATAFGHAIGAAA